MSEKEFKVKSEMIYGILKSLLGALLITAVMLLILSAVYLATDLSEKTSQALVSFLAIFSVFISSLTGSLKIKRNGLLKGALIGILYSFILYMTGFLAFGFPGFNKGLLSTMALCTLSGILGGVIGVNIGIKGK